MPRLGGARAAVSPLCLAVLAACAPATSVPVAAPVIAPAPQGALVQARLRDRLAGGDGALVAFYEARDFLPTWVGDSGLSLAAAELIGVAAAAADGLDPRAYALDSTRALAAGARDTDGLAGAEVMLTRLWLAYGGDLARGQVMPERLDTMWSPSAAAADPLGALSAAVAETPGTPVMGIAAGLDALRPPHAGYARLRHALGRYREIADGGGWDSIAPGGLLTRGTRSPRVAALRRRLAASGDLDTAAAAGAAADAFDGALEEAVRRFQSRHGLPVDGRVGPATRSALNVPVAARVRQLVLNLERWRWLPRALGARYVMVNSAGFTLEAMEGDSVVVRTRAIAGRPEWPTPLASGTLTHVVLNPAWHVPRDITRLEVLPAVRGDSTFLAREGMRVYAAADSLPVDPDTVDWAAVPDTAVPYRFVQDPGPRNPLGRVKLVFANRFGVALHDTPDPALFQPAARAFSHGCVRVEGATDLAAYALRGTRGWTRDSILRRLDLRRERWIALAEPMAVHLVYWTAWVARDGRVEFRDDIYGWDRKLEQAISR
jgi:murein L,D-transpeptidase YcbB/YkuD